MTDKGWSIPSDWDGETWDCISLQWPASEQYRQLLIGLLYTLTRGREYDRDTGVIKAAQQSGWAIFDANTPLAACGGDGQEVVTPNTPFTIEYRGGSLIVISEDDMGQVVTEVKFDPVTKKLTVYYGKCCPDVIDLASIVTGDGVQEPEDITNPPTQDDGTLPGEVPDFYICGKVTEVMDRVAAIGHAAWNNRETPGTMASAIRAANPGYSVSMLDVTNLYLVGIQLSAVEVVGDTDIFNSEMLRDWKCWLLDRVPAGTGGISKADFNAMFDFLMAYPWEDEVPDLDFYGGVLVADWWRNICQLVLGRERFNQIMLEGAATQADCSECGGVYEGFNPITDTDWYVVQDFVLNRYQWTPYSGQATYVPGTGWVGSEVNDGSNIRIQSSQVGDTEASLVQYLRVEYSLVVGDETSDGHFIVSGDNPNVNAVPWSLWASSGGVVEIINEAGIWNFDIDGGDRRFDVWMDSNDQGEIATVITKIIMAGTGVKPLDDSPYTL